jgi:hypothetical protein
MLDSKGEFLLNIQELLSSLEELKELLDSYKVKSITELKNKIDSKELPEHPTYEDYLDCLGLYEILSESKGKIMEELKGADIESFK